MNSSLHPITPSPSTTLLHPRYSPFFSDSLKLENTEYLESLLEASDLTGMCWSLSIWYLVLSGEVFIEDVPLQNVSIDDIELQLDAEEMDDKELDK